MKDEQTIVIGIPGKWKDREAFVQAIEEKSGGFTFAGMVLMHNKSKESFGLEVFEHDENLKEAFEYAGMGNFSEELLNTIDEHTFTLYIIGEGGNLNVARKIMAAAQALLKAGGLAVKIETTGKAFTPEQWDQLCAIEEDAALFDAFVTKLRAEGDIFYTCGMHNLGLRDAIIGAVEMDVASYTLDIFSIYQIMENPNIHDGESFSAGENMPTFGIDAQEDSRYPEEDGFFNKNGLWILRPITGAS